MSNVTLTSRVGPGVFAAASGSAPAPGRERFLERAACAGGLLIGLVFASFLYGWGILNVRNVDWLLDGGDIISHFLGWDFFRHDAWRWPPGANPSFGYTVGNTVVFSDSVPLLALFFKIFAAVLPDPFQYQGLVLFVNFMLNGCLAALLAYRLGGRVWPAWIVSGLVVAGTIVTNRGYSAHSHEALTAHWLILAAFVLVWTRQAEGFDRTRPRWVLLIIVSALIHFYLLVMVLAIWASAVLHQALLAPQARWRLAGHAATVLLLLWLAMYVAGYFSGVSGLPTAGGFGHFSANLLTFVNPYSAAWFFARAGGVTSFSSLLPPFAGDGAGQYEGQAYMGLGILMLTALGAGCWLVAKRRPWSRGASILALAALPLSLLALSHVVYLGGREIVNLPLAQPLAALLGVVRSSGRFIWVLYYLLLFGAFSGMVRCLSPRVALACLGLAFSVQMVDLAPWHAYLRTGNQHLPGANPLAQDVQVNQFVAQSARMIFLPVKNVPDGFAIFSFIAVRHGMAVNATYAARTSEALLARANLDETHRLASGAATPDEVYVVSESTGLAGTVCQQPMMSCLRVGPGMVLMRARPR